MIVITADQVRSRSSTDITGTTRAALNARYGEQLPLPVDRNAGDELQLILPDGRTALDVILDLTRTGRWSIGLGVGRIGFPLPEETREASGSAFIAARAAVTEAKKKPLRLAVVESEDPERTSGSTDRASADDVEALINLLLSVRSRRSPEGWEVADLLAEGLTQQETARRLGITPQAVGKRMSAAGVRLDREARAPLAALIDELDAPSAHVTTSAAPAEHTKE